MTVLGKSERTFGSRQGREANEKRKREREREKRIEFIRRSISPSLALQI